MMCLQANHQTLLKLNLLYSFRFVNGLYLIGILSNSLSYLLPYLNTKLNCIWMAWAFKNPNSAALSSPVPAIVAQKMSFGKV